MGGILCGGDDAVKIVGISEKSHNLKSSSHRVLSIHTGGVFCGQMDRVGSLCFSENGGIPICVWGQ